MEVIRTLEQIEKFSEHVSMAIGVFDGFHIGHQELVSKVVRQAHRQSGKSILLSFYPHPQKVISSSEAPPLLQTFEQRAEFAEHLGLDILLSLPFSRRFSLMTPGEFVDAVLLRSGVSEVHVGDNFRFGHRRQGDFETLVELGRRKGFSVKRAEAVHFREKRVSSTWVRGAISKGSVSLAKRLLGRPYEVRGNIVKGAQRGKGLGFPTANLNPENELIPATGVYATRVHLESGVHIGATNIGYRPTVHEYREQIPTVETHLMNFSDDIYGMPMRLDFCFRLRDERKFEDISVLERQINVDIERAKRYVRRVENQLGEAAWTK